jgi:hypothetical protein
MDADLSQPVSASESSSLARGLKERRERLQALGATQRRRLSDLETRILAQIDQAALEIAAEREASRARQTLIERRAAEEDSRSAALATRAAELDHLALELDRRHSDLAAREEALATRAQELEAEHAERKRELARRAKELPERLLEIEQREAELERRQAELDRRQAVIAERTRAAEQAEAAAEAVQAAVMQAQLSAKEAQTLAAQEQRAAEEDLSRRQAKLAAQREELNAAAAKLADDEKSGSERLVAAERQLAAFKKELDDRQHAIHAETAKLAEEREELTAATNALRQAERALAAERQAADQELALVKRQYEERTASLERQRQNLAEDQERTVEQRRRIAEQLKRERALGQQVAASRLAELEALVAQGHAAHEALLADANREVASLSERLRERGEELAAEVAAHKATRAEIASTAAQLEEATRACSAAAQQVVAAQHETAALRRQLADLEAAHEQDLESRECRPDVGPSESETRLRELAERLSAERDDLMRRLADTESALAEAQAAGEGGAHASNSAELEDLTQRYEMAVRDIRELKKKNEELEKRASTPGRPVAAAPGVPLDWEARKRQLLASLEADDGEAPEEERREEITRIEDVVRETDAELRKRDEEIEELRRQLEEQETASASAAAAVSVANVADLLDHDEVVAQERARIKQLEAELEQKLRQAEIEMSVQRAQLARAQADVAERQRALEDQGAPHEPRATNDPANKAKKQQRGRWLSRLGLAEDEK